MRCGSAPLEACFQRLTHMTIETRIEQISTVILQLDDSKVPRNIRAGAKEAVDKWLLNKSKDLDVRIAMA
ncbi:MAG TPA: hypothetical protein EYN17_05270, partial [Candidatus Poseidoniales archaeon]|nr:hypothetical protein [Candidatus Poseidoniales archaeon]